MSAHQITAEVVSIEAVTDYVKIVKMKPLEPAQFLAGQYLQVVLSDDDKRIFSIASSPTSEFIELHIGAGPGDAYPQGALDHLAENKTVTLEIGLGHAHLNSASERPIVLMAGGTGFSYVKSIADYLAETKPFHTVLLYWGAKDEESLYASEYLAEWANKFPHFQYIPVVEEAEDNWSGKVGYVHQAVMEDIVSLEPYDIYLAGPFKMAGIAREDFISQKGAIKEHMFADAFAFI
ncbi:NAD(P)H-flavin reductase [Psychrosphaera haliotis]|uniref:NAD(P)H-flavin reductase n=1 Tax=Psychrosphaera haliotis TaxID=555083 RepID=A0A6N8FDT0_9GAMM|nr:NAD(P)H-flavin reductase [Psychrosphaera haliotis]MDB2374238.1 NAD(P)H-flavin reductase [Psychrosphaera haliotis]MUH73317.1 NAD(P)H-flavin reductase [Psychrosphaera haliotis]